MRTRRRCASSSLPSRSNSPQPLPQLDLDRPHGPLDDLVARHVVRGRVDGHVVHLVAHLAREHVEGDDALDGVAEHLDPQRLLLVGRVDLHGVATGPEGAADQVDVVAGVLEVDQPPQDLPLVVVLPTCKPRMRSRYSSGEPNP